jgi:hypothetical protein
MIPGKKKNCVFKQPHEKETPFSVSLAIKVPQIIF